MINDKINIGVVGTGKLGTYHIQKLLKQPTCHFVGIHDLNRKLMESHKQQYQLNIFDNMASLVEKCDAIIIATPTITHYELAKYAIENNLHVFIEKPMTKQLDHAIELSSLAKKKNRIIQIGHIERFNQTFVEAQNYIDRPHYIDIHRISPFSQRSLDISVVTDVMIHDLDILLAITKKSPVIKIDVVGAPILSEHIDAANARIEFKNGLVANVTASRISNKQMRKIRIFQHKLYLGIDLLEKKLDLLKLTGHKPQPIECKTMNFNESDALNLELVHFIDCIKRDKTPIVSDKDGIDALDLAIKIRNLIRQKIKNLS